MKVERYSKYFDNHISYNHLCYINPDWHEVLPQIHDGFEIIFVIKGKLIYSTNKRTYPIKENSIIITRPGDYHMLNLENHEVYERYDIIFDEKIIMDSALSKLPGNIDIISLKNPDMFLSLFKKFDFYCHTFSGDELSRLVSHLVEEVFFNIVYISGSTNETILNTSALSNPILEKVTEYIENNISLGFTVESVCNELYVSKSYLLKLFNSHMQMSPKKYILSRRMIRAQNLLRLGHKPTQIPPLCGFSEYSSFYRSYKSFFGYPPSEESDTPKIGEISY